MGVSLRTMYRDVATLAAFGAPVAGAAGLGYVLGAGFFLPPLMFDEDELDALILGLRLVAERGDPALERAAQDALTKIAAVLPSTQADAASSNGLVVASAPGEWSHLAAIRHAIHRKEKLRLACVDKAGRASQRVDWPVVVGFFAAAEVLAAWCETRSDFRHFRLDRIQSAECTGTRYGRRRRMLLAEWRQRQDLHGPI